MVTRNRSFETHSGWGAAVTLSAYVAGSSTPTALAIGVAAGILFAPQKGSDTRKELKKKADEIGKEVSDKVGEKMDEMKKYVEEIANDAKTKFKKVEDA